MIGGVILGVSVMIYFAYRIYKKEKEEDDG
jgi:hypothetical protein